MVDKNNWEISSLEIENTVGKKYKVARRYPYLSVAETKVFSSKTEAEKQLKELLQN